MLQAFFHLCSHDVFARTIKYFEVPEWYTWDQTNSAWKRRVRGVQKVWLADGSYVVRPKTIGRLYSVSPKVGDLFYLRLLLVSVAGHTSFTNIRTINGETLPTLNLRLCLLDNDDHLRSAMTEVPERYSPEKLRQLFVTIACCCDAADLLSIWEEFTEDLCQDILHQYRLSSGDNAHPLSNSMKISMLRDLECRITLCDGISLRRHGFIIPDANAPPPTRPTLITRESDRLNLDED